MTVITGAIMCGCEPDDSPATSGDVAASPLAQSASQSADALHKVIDDAWSKLTNGDGAALGNLFDAKRVSKRVAAKLSLDPKMVGDFEVEFEREFSNVRAALLRSLSIWQGGYWRTRMPVASGSEFDVEVELFHNDRGMTFLHLLCVHTPDGWVIVDFYSDSDGTFYSTRAARFSDQLISGQTNEGDMHRLQQLAAFIRNHDFESFRRAYAGLPESLKLDRGVLMMASNAAGMLEKPEWADEIRKRYIDTYGRDATWTLFELDYYSGREDWKALADVCAILNKSKGGSAPVLYLKSVAELSDNNPQDCVDSATEGVKVDPDFSGNWLQAVAGLCSLKQYEQAADLVSKTVDQFPDLQFDWSADVFPGLTDSTEFQDMVAARNAADEDAPPADE